MLAATTAGHAYFVSLSNMISFTVEVYHMALSESKTPNLPSLMKSRVPQLHPFCPFVTRHNGKNRKYHAPSQRLGDRKRRAGRLFAFPDAVPHNPAKPLWIMVRPYVRRILVSGKAGGHCRY